MWIPWTFTFGNNTYYKISDTAIPFEDIKDGTAYISETDHRSGVSLVEDNFYTVGYYYCFVILRAGDYTFGNGNFTAPSAGVYFYDHSGIQHTASVDLTYYSRYQAGLIVNSPTKKWKLTVDDSGTISATEITS